MSGPAGTVVMRGGAVTAIPTVVQHGNYTTAIYTFIREGRFEEVYTNALSTPTVPAPQVVKVLSNELESFPRSRAALSLLAYSYYHMGDYEAAVTHYEQLTHVAPDVDEYKIYHAQALQKAGKYDEAIRLCTTLADYPQYEQRIQKQLSANKYEKGDLPGAKAHIDRCLQEDPDVIVLQGCVDYSEGKYDEARQRFMDAQGSLGFLPQLAYNVAVCYYATASWHQSLHQIARIIDRGIQDHPDLGVAAGGEGVEVRSVGNSQLLRETALIEAFNLKAAIEFQLKNMQGARDALIDMPPRATEELDPITLHNSALMNMDEDPSGGFGKLQHCVQNPPCPQQTFQNLLLLQIKFGRYFQVADILAENAQLSMNLSQDLYDFLNALITNQTSPPEAYRKLDVLASKHIDVIRKLEKQVDDDERRGDQEAKKNSQKALEEAVDAYMPVLMAQAKIYWDIDHFAMVEKIFRQSATDALSRNEVWRLNVAHAFFMQDKFFEAIRYYQPMVDFYRKKNAVLSCSAIVLANLCVCYIMTSQNEKAEDVMRVVEREEDRVAGVDAERQQQPTLHFCIMNLVIGTLYCAKGNHEFGISRIIKSLEPYEKKIMTDTWFYAKRCFLAVAEALAKHMIMLRDQTMEEILVFFDKAAIHGKEIFVRIPADPTRLDKSYTNTVRYEARLLKRMFLRLADGA